jgi:hypothetical protein
MGGFRRAVLSKRQFSHDETSLPRQLFFFPRFTTFNFGNVWMSIKGYINQRCKEMPTELHMGIPAPTTNFFGLSVTFIETQRKAAINDLYQ